MDSSTESFQLEALQMKRESLATQIAQKAPIATRLAKEAVLKALDTPLEEGLQFERKNFYLLFVDRGHERRE